MAARPGVTEGLRTGVFLALGLGAGAVVWAAAAPIGLAVAFQAAPALLQGFKVAGGMVLLWMGWRTWRRVAEPPAIAGGAPSRGVGSAFRLGVVTQLANPKPAMFFGAVLVGAVPPDATPWALAALLAAIFLNESACNVVVARLFSFDGPRRGYARLKIGVDQAFGGLLAPVGLKIAAT